MPLEEQKRWIIFVTSRNFTTAINELSVPIYLSIPKTEKNSRKKWFWLACEHRRIDDSYGGAN